MDYAYGCDDQGDYLVCGVRNFDLAAILDCGQCFRWVADGEGGYQGIVAGRRRRVSQKADTVRFHGVDEAEFFAVWRDYFDLGRDYGAVKELLNPYEPLRRAVAYSPGIRVLRQDSWEALCTFILSQNNNIPRIKGLVERLCALCGEPLPGGGHTFPPPEALAGKSPEELAPVRCGFRAKYLIDAASRVISGELPLESLRRLPLEQCVSLLTSVHGVGPKVAACALLYGCGRTECVPVDVWIKRALENWFPDGLPKEIAPVAGLAQQYLFHYIRTEDFPQEDKK